ncbi:cell wall metabolism sensor histidine kinase WalK [Cloacibacillus evryensis]|uniref:sensor histidine kinase n=1 Tax=Cloacibacillus evryensis TaxID=508460 RepID=UPI00210C90E4|nr:HAMP domain-containing sensor histidine kinase [Cloacibacillus evryensis]MCQ4762950.1 HAMP domain-containing histidine kinase [Cloacibacillus evryensis]
MNIKRSLRTKLIFQYMVIVIVCMLVIPTAISELLDRQFRGFATERLRENELEVAEFFAKMYIENGSWQGCSLFPRGSDFLRWPMVVVQLFDEKGVEVRKYSRMMKREGHHNKNPEPMAFKGDLLVSSREIIIDGVRVGEVRFTCLPFNNSPEGGFLRKFNKIMYYAVALMLVVAAMIAVFMAYRISRPVLNAAKRAQQISHGKYRMEDRMESDITELQALIDSVDRLGESLEAQEELRKRLLSDIAHELRNPVTIIKSHLEAIEDGVWEPTPERIRLTVSEVDRLSQLICEVEKLTYIEGAGHSLALENIDASSVIERAALVFDPLYKNKGVELKREIQPDVMMVMDGAKIRQVIENLLSNALRYTDAGGAVTVSMSSDAAEMRIEVADSGIGIGAADLPYIFERFYRTDVSRARTSGGIGIGLAIVKAIVEAHDGTITVASDPGEGSRFTVRIPRKDTE